MNDNRRPFDGYVDQPDTAERIRLAVQTIPFALPEVYTSGCLTILAPAGIKPDDLIEVQVVANPSL